MTDNTNEKTPLSAAQHALHNLRTWRESNGKDMFPGEAIGILERFVAQAAEPMPVSPPNIWPNGCSRTVPAALRYLSSKPRPSGGEQHYNSEHLLQLANEIERAVANSSQIQPQPVLSFKEMLAQVSDDEIFDLLIGAGRSDNFEFRVPGTMRYEKIKCAVLSEQGDAKRLRAALVARVASKGC